MTATGEEDEGTVRHTDDEHRRTAEKVPTTAVAQPSVLDIARDMVSTLAPDELPNFDFVADAYARNPSAARRASRSGSEPTAAGWEMAGDAVTVLALAVATDICKDLLISGARAVSRRHGHRLGDLFRRPKVGAETAVPPVDPDRVQEIETKAVAAARRHGAPESKARQIASALLSRWPRSR